MIRIKRKRNPNLKGEEFIDDQFIDFLYYSIRTSNLIKSNEYIAHALVYKNIGLNKCEDCSDDNHDIFYDECKCEQCEDCNSNVCTCNLDTLEKSRNYSIHLAEKYLNKKQLLHLRKDIKSLYETYNFYRPQFELINNIVKRKYKI